MFLSSINLKPSAPHLKSEYITYCR